MNNRPKAERNGKGLKWKGKLFKKQGNDVFKINKILENYRKTDLKKRNFMENLKKRLIKS